MEQKYFDIRAVSGRRGKCNKTTERDVSRGLLPPPIFIAGRRYWLAEELQAIDEARTRGAGDDEIRILVANLQKARTAGRAAA